MWLDRISGHQTSLGAPVNNRNSPVPRRPSYLSPSPHGNRSGAGPQSSLLSLSSSPNASTTSLPGLARGTNGSVSLKQSATETRPANVADPLEVLNGIIGKEGREASYVNAPPPVFVSVTKPAQLVEDVPFEGRSLQEFVADEDGSERSFGNGAPSQTVQQFEKERDKFQGLHTAIIGCDDVSKSVELYLNDFQRELGAVSAEIETLQARSIQLNAMLDNRRNVERILGPAVEEISVSPRTVKLIAEGPIDENWVRALNDIEARVTSVESKVAASNSNKAVEDVRPLLSDIKSKVSIFGPCLYKLKRD